MNVSNEILDTGVGRRRHDLQKEQQHTHMNVLTPTPTRMHACRRTHTHTQSGSTNSDTDTASPFKSFECLTLAELGRSRMRRPNMDWAMSSKLSFTWTAK